jgi:SAM-dependent methyltransferase
VDKPPEASELTGLVSMLYEGHLQDLLPRVRVALELGPGTHPLLPRLGNQFRTVGVDVTLSKEALASFDECHVGSAESLPLPTESVDLIVAKWVLEHIDDPERALAEVARVLTPGGSFAFITPNRNYPTFLASLWVQRLLPFPLARRLIVPLAKRRSTEVYRSFYRMSTRRRLEALWAPYGKAYVEVVEGETTPYGIDLHLLMRGRLRRFKPFLIGHLERSSRRGGPSQATNPGSSPRRLTQ